jgi:hypothetical protein
MTFGSQPPPQAPTPAAPIAASVAPIAVPSVATASKKKTISPRSATAGRKRTASEAAAASEATQLQQQPTLHRVGKDGEPLSEKKLRRLEKNRLSARECRRRKREATENMQGQINQLEGENLRLRLQLQVSDRFSTLLLFCLLICCCTASKPIRCLALLCTGTQNISTGW